MECAKFSSRLLVRAQTARAASNVGSLWLPRAWYETCSFSSRQTTWSTPQLESRKDRVAGEDRARDKRRASCRAGSLALLAVLILLRAVGPIGSGAVAAVFAGLELAIAAVIGALVLLDLGEARYRTLGALSQHLQRAHAETAGWRALALRAEATLALRTQEALALRNEEGLGAAIDSSFADWQLTPAESEVALLLLKGLSHKEVASARDSSERTVRQQARSVYRKAGLGGRACLSAFFLEDLLAPSTDPMRGMRRMSNGFEPSTERLDCGEWTSTPTPSRAELG